jgi:uncharacterized phage-associated protein
MEIKEVRKFKPTINDLITYFLLKEPMSQKKVQKLSYYAQAWSLVFLDEDIVKGIQFQAWVHGPVNIEIRKKLGKYGYNDIVVFDKNKDIELLKKENYEKFSIDSYKVLEEVWKAYGNLTANDLEIISHKELPWKEKRVGLGCLEDGYGIISNDTMKEFYAKQLQ